MLVISRKKFERILVAGEIEITILQVGRNRVRFGIKAPKHVAIQTHLKGLNPDESLSLPEAVAKRHHIASTEVA